MHWAVHRGTSREEGANTGSGNARNVRKDEKADVASKKLVERGYTGQITLMQL